MLFPLLAYLSYDPITRIDLGPLEVSPHGIMIAVGFLVGARFILPAAKRSDIPPDHLFDTLSWALAGGLVAARLVYVLNHLSNYADQPLDVFRVWEGGISLLGGLAGAVAAGYPKLRRLGIPFWHFMDVTAPGIALGIAVGRLGDLIIADHLGKPTDFLFGYLCTEARTGSPCVAPVGEAVHQTALYDMVGAALVFALLVWLARRPRREAVLTLAFTASYGLVRFIEGFARLDVTHGTGLNGSQWTALVAGTAAAGGLIALRRRAEAATRGALDQDGQGVSELVDHGHEEVRD